jgi:hypothetical protein
VSRAALLLALATFAQPAAAGGLDLGLRAGAMLFQIERGPGVLPMAELEMGYVPALLDGRFRVALVWGGGAIRFSQHGADVRLLSVKDQPGESYSGTVSLDAVSLSFEVGIRILSGSRRASPYIVWRPRVLLLRTVVDLTISEADLGTVHQWKWYPTAEGGAGVEIRLGGGQLFAELVAGFFPLHNEVIGNATGLSLTAALGYRYVFGG